MANTPRVNISRIYKCDAKTLFDSIAEGALFRFTGADMSKATMDFKVGGKLHLDWADYGVCNGVFEAIQPYEKIVFTWNSFSRKKNKEENTGSRVTITIKEKNNVSLLTLVHDGLESLVSTQEHNEGWVEGLESLRDSFRELIAKFEGNNTGLDLRFKLRKIINVPQNVAFEAVLDEKQLMCYFRVDASGPLSEGSSVIWKFEGHQPLTLNVHQVVQNQLIKFQWGQTHVCFSFRDLGDGNTEVTIEATGWRVDQASLNDSYSECDGWMEFLLLLKFHLEGRLLPAKGVSNAV